MNKTTIYLMDELKSKDFDDEEIDVVQKNLLKSLIIGMFNYANINMSQEKILSFIKEDNWFNKYFWTRAQKNKFQKDLNIILYNLYRFSPIKCQNSSDEFLLKYGFKINNRVKRYEKT